MTGLSRRRAILRLRIALQRDDLRRQCGDAAALAEQAQIALLEFVDVDIREARAQRGC